MIFSQHTKVSTCISWFKEKWATLYSTDHESHIMVRKSLIESPSKLLLSARLLVFIGVFGLFFSQFFQNFLFIGPLLILFSKSLRKSLMLCLSNPICICIVTFLAITMLGCLYSDASLSDIYHQQKKYLTHYTIIPFYLLLFNDKLWREKLFNCLIISSLLFCLFSFLHHAPTHAKIQEISVLLAAVCFLCLQKLLYTDIYKKILFAFSFSFIFYSILYTVGERVGIIIVFFAINHFVFSYNGRKVFVIYSVIFVFCLILAFHFQLLPERIYIILHSYHAYKQSGALNSISLRLVEIKSVKYFFLQHPLFGYGTGSFMDTIDTPITYLSNHVFENSFVEILLQNGLLGLFSFMLLLFVFYKQSFLLTKHYRNLLRFTVISYALASFSFSVLVLSSIGMASFCLIAACCCSEIYSIEKL